MLEPTVSCASEHSDEAGERFLTSVPAVPAGWVMQTEKKGNCHGYWTSVRPAAGS